MKSVMTFKGGPLHGRYIEPENGYPAPDVAIYPTGWPEAPQRDLPKHRYVRAYVEETFEAVIHIYEYTGEET